MRLFSLRDGDWISDRVGRELASLVATELIWEDSFLFLDAFEIDLMLVSELHDALKKVNRIAERYLWKLFNIKIPSCLDYS